MKKKHKPTNKGKFYGFWATKSVQKKIEQIVPEYEGNVSLAIRALIEGKK
jgi:hypothetical protein